MHPNTEIPIDFMELAAVFVTLGHKLIHVERSGRRNRVFYFEPREDSHQLITQYFNSDLAIDPKQLFINLQTLKHMIRTGSNLPSRYRWVSLVNTPRQYGSKK